MLDESERLGVWRRPSLEMVRRRYAIDAVDDWPPLVRSAVMVAGGFVRPP